ncbi:MAG: acyl-CoA dehydrogenase family protein, partial [Planctomycetes bacterium]|nr:acyl-CoA dehydrogenase family protein [Planctomycetota bacterium]
MTESNSLNPGCPEPIAEPSFAGPEFQSLLEDLAQVSADLESDSDWPGSQFERLAEAGVLGWVIPAQFGGSGISAAELILGYEQLAAACLTTTFV